MIQASARVTTNKNASAAVGQGVKNELFEAMSAGFQRSQQIVASEATDRGTLLQSGFPPQEASDGSIVSGYRARHAQPVAKGSRPHWVPIRFLKGWARRVLGDESAAWGVQQKIAREGTDPVPYMDEFVATVKAHIRARGFSASISEVL